MILDVACGSNPHGDVNLDLGKNVLAEDSGPFTKANTYGSVYNLPFDTESFEVVHFVGVLHHLEEPVKAWKEMVRVAKDIIVGEEPSRLNPKAYLDKYHVYHGFWKRQLRKICENDIQDLKVMYYFNNPLRLNLHVTAIKRKRQVNST
jgi:ubiquinone/menaquinone biosynthesis C-methylase UbiE